MHFFLRNLIAEYPDKLRIVHRHFPMDHRYNPIVTQPFHEGSGVLALIAITACNHNIFWEANDYLYQYDMSKHAIYLRKIAKDIGIDLKILRNGINKHKNKLKLFQDIKYGLQHKLSGTPAYIINGQTYTGHIPPDIIRSLDEN
jgi:protein-disulfide isomerase